MAIHRDTPNAQLHVAVNRDPETYRAVSPFRDYIKLHRAMWEIELAQRWSHDRGPTQVREIEGHAPEVVGGNAFSDTSEPSVAAALERKTAREFSFARSHRNGSEPGINIDRGR